MTGCRASVPPAHWRVRMTRLRGTTVVAVLGCLVAAVLPTPSHHAAAVAAFAFVGAVGWWMEAAAPLRLPAAGTPPHQGRSLVLAFPRLRLSSRSFVWAVRVFSVESGDAEGGEVSGEVLGELLAARASRRARWTALLPSALKRCALPVLVAGLAGAAYRGDAVPALGVLTLVPGLLGPPVSGERVLRDRWPP